MADELVSEFEIIIQFDKEKARPEVLFASMSEMVSAFYKIDETLANVLDAKVRFNFVLEKVENGSLKAKFVRFLKSFDSNDVQNLDYKKMAGKYLDSGRLKVIEMLNNETITPEVVSDFEKELMDSAKPLLPKGKSPIPLSKNDLINGLEKSVFASAMLGDGERITYIEGKDRVDIKNTVSIDQKLYDIKFLANGKRTERGTILKVKKADLLGTSKWEFLSEGKTLKANIKDEDWLNQYHRKMVRVDPGDSLKVVWEYEIYSDGGKPSATNHTITKVVEVIPGQYEDQQRLFREEG
jgi:hypothetical protein